MSDTDRPRLLLHVCCAPCTVYVHQVLSEAYAVTCHFYNPNIQPEPEYDFRRTELERIAAMKQWSVLYDEYDPERWNDAVRGMEAEPERGARCAVCFRHRFERTFSAAAEGGFDIVASTLSISPYKNTRQINREGQRLSAETGIPFLAENFKKQDGYPKARKLALELGIRQQNYCGCRFSRAERERRLAGRS